MIAHSSVRLQREADKKGASALAMESDLHFDPNEWFKGEAPIEHVDPELIDLDIMKVLNETLFQGMSLADDLRKRNERSAATRYGYAHAAAAANPRQKIYVVTVNQAHGEAQFFFMGTVPSILKRLAKLQDEWT